MTRFRSACFVALTLAAAACPRSEQSAGKTLVTVRTATVVRAPFAHVVGALGAVVPRAGRYAELSAPAPTRVARIFVAAGDRVSAGAPLVEFERATFEAAAKSAETALVSTQHAYDRAVRLTDAGVLARKDLDLATAELAQAQFAAVSARRALELATLRAPIAGVITRMTAVLGAPVEANQPVVAIADPSALDLLFGVSPADAAAIAPGAPVAVTAGEDSRGERLGDGTVVDVGAAVDSAARSVAVRARLTHAARVARIGETVFGRITTGVRANAVLVPAAALVPEGESYHVFVVDADHVAHARPVSVGDRGEDRVEILSGVTAGEIVVTDGAYGVEDSTHVVPARDSAAARP